MCIHTRWGSTPLQEAQRFHKPRIVAILKKEMAKRGINVPVISEEDSEQGKASGESTTGRSVSLPSISMTGIKYAETPEISENLAALRIQGAFKRMKRNRHVTEQETCKPDVINM